MIKRYLLIALVFAAVGAACGEPADGQTAGGQTAGGQTAGAGGDSVSSDRDLPTSNPSPADDVVPGRTDTCPQDAESPSTEGPTDSYGDEGAGYFCPYDDRHPSSYRLVRARAGMTQVKPVPWNGVEVSNGGRTLTLLFVSGVEPCYVLDHVAVEEGRNEVTVTLYEGRDPAHPDAACIEIALNKAVQVVLDDPLGGRKVIDGTDR
jgi:hypothetical protein